MGSCFSSPVVAEFKALYDSDLAFRKWRNQFDALGLQKNEVLTLFKEFKKVDARKTGNIDIHELLIHMNVDRTRFNERIFHIFDEDKSGVIEFGEFVLSLWNYCTLSKVALGEASL